MHENHARANSSSSKTKETTGRLVLVSNRLPVHTKPGSGELVASVGGLATGLGRLHAEQGAAAAAEVRHHRRARLAGLVARRAARPGARVASDAAHLAAVAP